MKIPRAIIYPLKKGGSKFKNFELRHSLRSMHKHWQGDEPVFLLSEFRPPWLSDEITQVQAGGYMDALRAACEIADEILWMNDDIYLLVDMGWEDFRGWRRSGPVPLARQENWKVSKNGWRRKLGRVIERCRDMGLETYKYSSHSPYLYDTKKLLEVIEKFDMGYKTAIETAYGNYCDVPIIPSGDKIMRYHPIDLPLDISGNKMFNHDNRGFSPYIRGFLRGLFPYRSKFEV